MIDANESATNRTTAGATFGRPIQGSSCGDVTVLLVLQATVSAPSAQSQPWMGKLAPGVQPPPPPGAAQPPWMAKRPAGVGALIVAFDDGDLDLDALRAFDKPVYFALGGRSNPDYYARMAARLGAIFPDFTAETFPDRHHFDPPHRIEPERIAGSLLALWERAES